MRFWISATLQGAPRSLGLLAGRAAERGDSVGIAWIEQVDAGKIQLAVEVRALESVQIDGKAGPAMACLDGLIGGCDDGLPAAPGQRRSFAMHKLAFTLQRRQLPFD